MFDAGWDGWEAGLWNLRAHVGARRLSLGKAMTAEQKEALAGVVSIDKEVMHGTPCLADTRYPCRHSRLSGDRRNYR
jgi:hypothetical protein